MSDPVTITLPADKISVTDTGDIALKSHRLNDLVSSDPDLVAALISENGFAVKPADLHVDPNGIVKFKDLNLAPTLKDKINKKDLAALNICGLCKVG
jgi:hypothetical protein